MSDYSFDLTPLIWFVALAILSIWGCWELIDYFFIDEVIKSSTIIKPEIEIQVENNIIDTLYIYRKQ